MAKLCLNEAFSDSCMGYADAKNLLLQACSCFEQETISRCIFENGIRHPGRHAYEWYDPRTDQVEFITYGGLITQIAVLGSELYRLGFKGKTIALIGKASYPWILFFLAALCGDMVVLPLDPDLDGGAVAKRLRHCRVSLVVTESENTLSKAEIQGIQRLYFKDTSQMLRSGSALLRAHRGDWPGTLIREKQPCLMVFTSGTGGGMKAAVLRQENLTVERFVWRDLLNSKDKSLLTYPLNHIAGIGHLRGTLLTGSTTFLSRGLRELLDELNFVRPAVLFVVPAQTTLLFEILNGCTIEEGRKRLGGNLKGIVNKGAPLPEKMRELFALYGIDIVSEYGLTECCGGVTASCVRDGKLWSKPGSVGMVIEGLDVSIDCPDEHGIGEVIIMGQNVFDGYFEDESQTRTILYDGAIHTGDLGYLDEERFLYIVGRKKNIIISPSGENIIPEELEAELYRIPGVKECLVYEKDGEAAARIYTGSADAMENERFKEVLRSINRSLPVYKRIKQFELSSEPLLKTGSGKIRRNG